MSFISKLLSGSSASRAKKESKQNRNKSLSSNLPAPVSGEDESDDEVYALRAEGSRHVHSDPVPNSFKNNSFAGGARTGFEGSGLTVEVANPAALSSDSMSGSPCSPHGRRRSTGYERPRSPMLSSGSYKSPFVLANTSNNANNTGQSNNTGDGSPPGAATFNGSSSVVIVRGSEPPSVVRDGGAQQCWNLPWVQQKVTMCPYCQRPIRPSQETAGAVHSSADDVHGGPHHHSSAADDLMARRGSDRNLSEPSLTLSNSDDDMLLEEDSQTRNRAYCHCEHRAGTVNSHRVSGLALDASTPSKSTTAPVFTPQASGSVFVLRTERSAAERISGVIAEDSSESESDGDSTRRGKGGQRLCLVAPSPALTARTSQLHSRQPSPNSKVRSWSREQEQTAARSPASQETSNAKAIQKK